MTTPHTPKCEQWHRDAGQEIADKTGDLRGAGFFAHIIAKHDAKQRDEVREAAFIPPNSADEWQERLEAIDNAIDALRAKRRTLMDWTLAMINESQKQEPTHD